MQNCACNPFRPSSNRLAHHDEMQANFRKELENTAHRSPPFARVGSILPTIGVTSRRLKRLNSVVLVREQREQRKQEVAFNARPFVLCGLPLRPLPNNQLVYKRRNGNFFLQIVAHPDYGLPTVRADCTCSQFALGMGRNSSSLPPAAGSAL